MPKPDVRIFDNLESLSLDAAKLITEAASRRTVQGQAFTVALSGGTTPKRLFQLMVIPNYIEKFKMYRLTLTFPVINAAEQIVFMVAGADKAKALGEVLAVTRPKPGSDPLPAQRIQPVNGSVTWLVDREAARLL